ncbi:MAG: dienelactone hydrolase family protein [Bacillota bacterium]
MGFIHLPDANGLRCYLAEPSAPGPGVVVLHAWWGLVADVVDACDTLAANGFVALAPDLYGGRVAETPEEAERLVEEGSWAARAEMTATAEDWLRRQPSLVPNRVALVGFSLGAGVALLAAARGVGDAVVTFYGTMDLGPAPRIAVPLLGHFAEADPFEPAPDVAAFLEQLRAGGTAVTARTYPGTGHWFCEPSRTAYHPEAAEAARAETLEFLRRHLGGAAG